MRSRSRAIAVAAVSLPSAAFIQAGINGEEAFSLPSYPHPENGSQNGRYDDLFSHILLAISGETRHADRIRELIEQQRCSPDISPISNRRLRAYESAALGPIDTQVSGAALPETRAILNVDWS